MEVCVILHQPPSVIDEMTIKDAQGIVETYNRLNSEKK